MNKIPNRQVICDTLIELGQTDPRIMVLTSDSRGSASMGAFASQLPAQFVEVGIAEQNIVGIAAGLAASGLRPFVASPASFLSMRSIEQVKVDVAYSHTNVKLIGISGGISYGALGMSHHSVQDLAVMRAIPGIDIVLPADRHSTRQAILQLAENGRPAYIRIGRNPVEDVYSESSCTFTLGKANTLAEGCDLTIIAAGELVRAALDAAVQLSSEGIACRVLDMHTIKPLDEAAIIKAARETGLIITLEEHSIFGGLGGAVAEVTSRHAPVPVRILGIPDEPAIAGKSAEVFTHYGLDAASVAQTARQMYLAKNL